MELSDDALRSIVAHLAHLRAAYGEVLADPDLVEPNGEYFPDPFALEPAAIDRLMRRMMTYAPLADDLDVQVAFVEPEEGGGGGGCGSGACGPGDKASGKQAMKGGAVETPDGYAVVLATGDVGEPKLLTASLARSMGRLVLFEADEEVDPRVEGALSELTAVACGLGVILLNGAALYKKGCGGVKRHQGTFLGVEELALANALFVRVTDRKPSSVRRHLDVTQREAFDIALAWVDGQPKLVKALAKDPASLADGIFTLEEKKGFLSRILAPRKTDDDEDLTALAAPRPAKERSEEERRRLAETRALVEEALQDS
ncbi:hypothetical protein BH11MYX4_BH11MYX4_25690 [soil metagenome]